MRYLNGGKADAVVWVPHFHGVPDYAHMLHVDAANRRALATIGATSQTEYHFILG